MSSVSLSTVQTVLATVWTVFTAYREVLNLCTRILY